MFHSKELEWHTFFSKTIPPNLPKQQHNWEPGIQTPETTETCLIQSRHLEVDSLNKVTFVLTKQQICQIHSECLGI